MTRSSAAATLAMLALWALTVHADKRLDDAVTKADQQLASKTPEEAEKTLQKLVPSGGAEAYVALARVQLRLGKEDEAGLSLEQARGQLAAAPAAIKSLLHAARAEHSLIAGAHQDAIARAKDAVAAEPSARALAVLARAQARAGDAGALVTAERAVAAGASHGGAHAAKGEALLAQRKWSEAESAFREAVRLDPGSALPKSGLALALSEQDKHVEAVTAAKQALDVEVHSADAMASLAHVLLRQDPQKNWTDAIAQAQNATFENPKSAIAYMVVAEIFEAAGNALQADEANRKALAIDPKLPMARLAGVRRRLSISPKDASAGAEACALATDMPASGEAQLWCAIAKLGADDVVSAIPYLEKAVASSPGNADAQFNLGRAYFLINQAPRAIAPCKQAVAVAPKRVEFLAACGLIIAKGGEPAVGITILTKATETDLKNVAAWTNLGWAYRNSRPVEVTKAIDAYGKALALDSRHVQAALGRGWARVYAKSWAPAEEDFLKALALDPNVAGDAYYGIARTWYFRGDMPKARAAAENSRLGGRDVTTLLKAIADHEDAVRRNQPPPTKMVDPDDDEGLAPLVHTLNRGSIAARRKACHDLGPLGADAVPHLASALTYQSQPDLSVRDACLDALCAMGKRASGAAVTMEYIIANPPPVIPSPTDADLKEEQAYSDFVTKMKGCLRKLKN